MALSHPGLIPTTAADPAPAAREAAAACLARHDLDGLRGLFAEAAELPGVHARYAARRVLTEHAIEAGRRERSARAAATFHVAAEACVAALEEEPREPVLLRYAGILLYELWSLDAAAALFEATRRLDPELPNTDEHLAAVRQRRQRARDAVIELPPAVAAALPGLAERAHRAAELAQPAEGLTLSLCMIVKDEEEMLPRCLATASLAADEIVVVDTGSSDRTIEIAESYGARVIEFPWTGSFSEARNVSMDAATGDWLLILDADEVLVLEDVQRLRDLRGKTWREAFYVSETNYTGELGDGTATTHSTARIFRNRPAYRYEGTLHEQIFDALPVHLPERLEATSIRVEHFGYLGAVRDAKEKSRRNVEILQRQLEAGEDTPFLRFNLGSEHGASGAEGAAEAALAEFERAWELLRADPNPRALSAGFVPALTARTVRALRICGRYEETIARAEEGLERHPGFTDLVFEQAAAAKALGRLDEAAAYLRRCLEMGDASSRYTATVGMGSFLATIALAELHHEQGDPETAAQLLDEGLAEHPGFFGLVLPFAAALLAQGADPGFVVARVEERVEELTPTVRFMLATALYEAGETAAAEQQYRALLERQPGSGSARVALAETLLSLRRFDDAAATAAALPDADPHAAAARRSELFARIVGGDLPGAAAVLARAEAAGLPAADRTLFAAWLAAAGGDPGDAVLPLEAVPLLAVSLEALLRIEEVDAFGTLVGLLDRAPIAPREQRELRAGMYLRRGFVASAAEEWMAACQADPADVRALVGLAQVAVAQGMPEEALEFAREAHAVAPDDARAALLVRRLENASPSGSAVA